MKPLVACCLGNFAWRFTWPVESIVAAGRSPCKSDWAQVLVLVGVTVTWLPVPFHKCSQGLCRTRNSIETAARIKSAFLCMLESNR
jgi:hypothetical protein